MMMHEERGGGEEGEDKLKRARRTRRALDLEIMLMNGE